MIAMLLRAAGCLVGLLILAAPVRAAIITTIEFEGTLTNTNMPGIAFGGDFEGSFRFENSSFISAGLAFAPLASPPGPSLALVGLGPGDTFLVVVTVTPGTGVDPASVEIKLNLDLDPGLPWPGDGNVTSWSILFGSSDLASSLFELRGDGCSQGEGCVADGVLTAVSASQSQSVPEPASLPLLISTLFIGLWLSGRGRQQSIQSLG